MSGHEPLGATPVGTLVVQNPSRARALERLGIDYCCGGKRTLADACAARGVELEYAFALLAEEDARPGSRRRDPSGMPLAELIADIEQTHHAHLRAELPRLDLLTEKVLRSHGDRDPRLAEVRRVFVAMRDELERHMMTEERVLFPMVRDLETGVATGAAPVSLRETLEHLESEHTHAGNALAFLRAATDGFTPPERACTTWRVLLDSLGAFERDMHEHVHKENNVLFPRALALEKQRRDPVAPGAPAR